MATEITRQSTLRPLADLIEAIDQDWPASTPETIVSKALAESKLLRVVAATIRHDLERIELAQRKNAYDALTEVALQLANGHGYGIYPGGGRTAAGDQEIIRALQEPQPPALVLERVAEALGIDVPHIVRAALDSLSRRQ